MRSEGVREAGRRSKMTRLTGEALCAAGVCSSAASVHWFRGRPLRRRLINGTRCVSGNDLMAAFQARTTEEMMSIVRNLRGRERRHMAKLLLSDPHAPLVPP